MSDKSKLIGQALSSFCSYSRYATDAELSILDHASGGMRDDGESLPYVQTRAYKWLTSSSMCERKESCGHTGFVVCGIPLPILMGVLRECRYQSMMQSMSNNGVMYALDTLKKPYKALVAVQVEDEIKRFWVITARAAFRPAFYSMLLAGKAGNDALAKMVDVRSTSKQSRQADGFGDSFYDSVYAMHGELRYRQGHMYYTRSTGSEAECKTVVANDGSWEGALEKRLPLDVERVLMDRTIAKAKVVIAEAGQNGSRVHQYYLINKHRTGEGQRRIYLVMSSGAQGLFVAAHIVLKPGDSTVFLKKTSILARWRDGMKDELFSTGYAVHVNREMLKDAGVPASPQGVPGGGPRPVRPPAVRPPAGRGASGPARTPAGRPAGPRGPAAQKSTMSHAHSAPPATNTPSAPPPTGLAGRFSQAMSYMKENPMAASAAVKIGTSAICDIVGDIL